MYRPPLSHMCETIFCAKKALLKRAPSVSYCIFVCLANEDIVSHFMVLALHFLGRSLGQADVEGDSLVCFATAG